MKYSQELHRTPIRDVISFSEGLLTIGDIVGLVNNTKDFRDTLKANNKLYSGSIAKRSAQLVLVFPVLVSSSISVNTAMLISKAIERKCVNMLQLLFSAINLTSYKDTKSVFDYISKFHKNLDLPTSSISLDDFIKAVDTIANVKSEFVIDRETYDKIISEFKQMSIEARNVLNEHSVNDYSIRRSIYGNEFDIRINEDVNDSNNDSPGETLVRTLSKLNNQDPSKTVINADKANELVPTLMQINFTTMIDGVLSQQKAIIGVKAKFYPVDSIELRGRLSKKFSDANGLFNFIRASTGEISFWKDLVFAFDKLKSDAINIAHGSTNSKIFNLLQNRADANNSFFNRGNNNPITTLVINQEEVEMLKKESNMDISNPKTAKILFNGFNLMGLVIVDDSTESAKFIFDDDSTSFEVTSYTALERENKEKSTIAKMVNILQKGGRI